MSTMSGGLGPISDPARLGKEDLAALIDHTILKPEATEEDVAQVCQEAVEYGFKSVCVNGSWVPFVAERVKGSSVVVCSVVGFPLGAMTSRAKASEAQEAVGGGAAEIDMVMAIGHLKGGDIGYVKRDIEAVRGAIGSEILLKVILETSKLTEEEKVVACEIARDAGADYVKTSTGFGGGGATPEDIALMRRVVGTGLGVKASGGIRDHASTMAVLEAGASRIGASSGVAIVTGA